MKFLIDMNLSPLWVSFLAEKVFGFVHWSTVGQPGAADYEIFDFAASQAASRLPAGNTWVIRFPSALNLGRYDLARD